MMLLEDIVPKTDQIVYEVETLCGRFLRSNGEGGLFRGSANSKDIRVISTRTMKHPTALNERAYLGRFLFNSIIYKEFNIQNILNKSLNCVNSSTSARQFGSNVYEVYPSDKTKILFNDQLKSYIDFYYDLVRFVNQSLSKDSAALVSKIVKESYDDSYDQVVGKIDEVIGEEVAFDDVINAALDKFHSIVNGFEVAEAHQRIRSINNNSRKSEFLLFDSHTIYMIKENDTINDKIQKNLRKSRED